jgi:hypothetical protein
MESEMEVKLGFACPGLFVCMLVRARACFLFVLGFTGWFGLCRRHSC